MLGCAHLKDIEGSLGGDIGEKFTSYQNNCGYCNSNFSTKIKAKLLFICNHRICENCIDKSISNNSITCPICETVIKFQVEKTGFLVGNLQFIRLFDDYDRLLNIYSDNQSLTIKDIDDSRKAKIELLMNFSILKKVKFEFIDMKITKTLLKSQIPDDIQYLNKKWEKSFILGTLGIKLFDQFKLKLLTSKKDILIDENGQTNYRLLAQSFESYPEIITFDFGRKLESLMNLLDKFSEIDQNSSGGLLSSYPSCPTKVFGDIKTLISKEEAKSQLLNISEPEESKKTHFSPRNQTEITHSQYTTLLENFNPFPSTPLEKQIFKKQKPSQLFKNNPVFQIHQSTFKKIEQLATNLKNHTHDTDQNSKEASKQLPSYSSLHEMQEGFHFSLYRDSIKKLYKLCSLSKLAHSSNQPSTSTHSDSQNQHSTQPTNSKTDSKTHSPSHTHKSAG